MPPAPPWSVAPACAESFKKVSELAVSFASLATAPPIASPPATAARPGRALDGSGRIRSGLRSTGSTRRPTGLAATRPAPAIAGASTKATIAAHAAGTTVPAEATYTPAGHVAGKRSARHGCLGPRIQGSTLGQATGCAAGGRTGCRARARRSGCATDTTVPPAFPPVAPIAGGTPEDPGVPPPPFPPAPPSPPPPATSAPPPVPPEAWSLANVPPLIVMVPTL